MNILERWLNERICEENAIVIFPKEPALHTIRCTKHFTIVEPMRCEYGTTAKKLQSLLTEIYGSPRQKRIYRHQFRKLCEGKD